MSDNITKRDLTLVVYNELKGEFAQRGERKLSQTQVYAVIESFQKHIVECLAEERLPGLTLLLGIKIIDDDNANFTY